MGRAPGPQTADEADKAALRFRILCKQCNSYRHTSVAVEDTEIVVFRCGKCGNHGDQFDKFPGRFLVGTRVPGEAAVTRKLWFVIAEGEEEAGLKVIAALEVLWHKGDFRGRLPQVTHTRRLMDHEYPNEEFME